MKTRVEYIDQAKGYGIIAIMACSFGSFFFNPLYEILGTTDVFPFKWSICQDGNDIYWTHQT